jgi:predicted metal-dependent hydrolase
VMESQIQLGDITVDVVLKNIKNINLTVHPPDGRVRISAPRLTSMEAVHAFATSHLNWIRKHQARLRITDGTTTRGAVEPKPRYVDGECHYLWGKPCRLTISESAEPPYIGLSGDRLLLRVRPRTNRARRQALLERWYRDQIRVAVPPLVARWEPRLGVRLERFYVQRMKTRWGTCNPGARTIRLNTELAARPPELLEYLVVHELVHLLEPTHNARFYLLMDRYMPGWKDHRRALNRQLPPCRPLPNPGT